MAAFASPAGFLMPIPAAAASVKDAGVLHPVLRTQIPGSPAVEVNTSQPHHGQVAIAATLCGFVASFASQRLRPSQRRRSVQVHVSSLDKAPGSIMPAEADDVERSISEFVPRIAALQNQAELLRSGELKQVIQTMKVLRKSELRGVFSEVDQLLCALIDAIHSLRESAVTIRKSELRQHFEKLDRDAQDWIGNIEKGAVQSLTGYDARVQEEVDTMMEVHVVGLSHHRAPVEVREKLAVPQPEWNKYSRDLIEFAQTPQGYLVPEVAVLSTCNRFELYFATPELSKFSAVEAVHAFLRAKSGLSREELEPYLFTHSGEEATQHLFEVSSGLDSLVLGEAQILAQVKACHEHAIEKEGPETFGGSGGKIVAKMLNAGIRMGKLVRTRTKIGKGSVSVSSAAVELMMSKSLADLKKYASNVHVSILGARKMSRLLLIALFSKHPDIKVTLVNRSVDNAEALLEEVRNRGGVNAKVAPMTDMWDVIHQSDVVFTATGSKEPIIMADKLQNLERKLMLVDISVPRNVATDCTEVEGVASYSVDDLKQIVQANAAKRQSEVDKAKRLIGREVGKFKVWQASQGAVPYLAALQSMAEQIRQNETEKMARNLRGLHEKEKEAVDKLTRHIIDQLFRPIYYSMKDEEEIGVKKNKIWALKSMFKLEPEYKRRLLSAPPTRGQLNA